MKLIDTNYCLHITSQTSNLINFTIFAVVAYFEFACCLLFINPERISSEKLKCCSKALYIFLFKCICVLSLIVHQIYIFYLVLDNVMRDTISYGVCLAVLSIIVIILDANYIINYRTSIFRIPYYGNRIANTVFVCLLNVILCYEYYFYDNAECKDTQPIFFCIIVPISLYLIQSISIFADFIDETIKMQNDDIDQHININYGTYI